MGKTLNDLSIGETIEVPVKPECQSYIGETVVWKIANKEIEGMVVPSVSLVTDKIIAFLCADAKEPNSNNASRKNSGNNDYWNSNIYQWLNSTKDREWYSAKHDADTPPSANYVFQATNMYDTWPGFLAMFEQSFVEKILDTTVQSLENEVTGIGITRNITAKMNLLSSAEIGFTSTSGLQEGTQMELFKKYAPRVAYCTETAVHENAFPDKPTGEQAGRWWLRTPTVTNAAIFTVVSEEGYKSSDSAYVGKQGVRPWCRLALNNIISNTPNSNGHYEIIPNVGNVEKLTTPEKCRIGGGLTITWTVAGYAERCVLERSVNKGGFVQVYSGAGLTFKETVQEGWEQIQYRVKAVVNDMESDYTLSNIVTTYKVSNYKPLSDLNVGDTIEIDGDPAHKHYWKDSNVYRIAGKNHTGYPANSVTIIMDRRYQFPICVDAKEPNNPDADRKKYGNNRYRYSNVHQWLNSNAAAGQWYTAQHEFDEPPISGNTADSSNLYKSWAGFLKMMGKDFEDKLLPTTVKVAKTGVDGGGYETFMAKLFLPSVTEVGLSKDGFTEGSKLALFSDNASRVAYYESNGVIKADSWVTRTPFNPGGRTLWVVNADGGMSGGNFAYSRMAPRPIGNLPGDTEIYGPYPNGHYRLAPKELPTYQNLIIGGAV